MVIKDKTEVLLSPCAVVLTHAVEPCVVSCLSSNPNPWSLVDQTPWRVVTAYWPRCLIIGWPETLTGGHCLLTLMPDHWLTGDPDRWSLLTDPDAWSLVDRRPWPVVTAYWPQSPIIGWPLGHCLLTPIPDHWLTPWSLLTDLDSLVDVRPRLDHGLRGPRFVIFG